MAPNERVLGFTNRWYAPALAHSQEIALLDGTLIRIPTGPLFVATKVEAFRGRGEGDFWASKDMEDIITVLDGRPQLVAEVQGSESELRLFLTDAFAEWLAHPDFPHSVAGHLPGDAESQERADIALSRLRAIVDRE